MHSSSEWISATLDSVVMAGYPGTTLSFWQQAGRAGRSGRESVVAMVARYDPIDQYYMHHPDRFFETAYEHAAIDCRNPIALSGTSPLCGSRGADTRF
jgi:Distinct helicase family with a unique C-terminal domain including a metal-binding cysteine cluster